MFGTEKVLVIVSYVLTIVGSMACPYIAVLARLLNLELGQWCADKPGNLKRKKKKKALIGSIC